MDTQMGIWQEVTDLLGWLQIVQADFFTIGGEPAVPGIEECIRKGHPVGPRVVDEELATIGPRIDARDEEIEPPRRFMLPGGTPTTGHLHDARIVGRRAGRCVLTIAGDASASRAIVRYRHRLSDTRFPMARAASAMAGITGPQRVGSDGRSAT